MEAYLFDIGTMIVRCKIIHQFYKIYWNFPYPGLI